MASSTTPVLDRLRLVALASVVVTVIQAGLGFMALSGGSADVHGYLGYLNFLLALVAAFFGFQASQRDAGLKGLFMHALSLPVLALVQIGIIEASHGTGPLKWVHVVLGVAYLASAVGLWTLAGKRAARR